MYISVSHIDKPRSGTVNFATRRFGTTFADHMLIMEFRNGEWGEPSIRPYGPLSLAPSISALHYGQSVFEGLKAHRSVAGEILLFRPEDNARRLNCSAQRLAMPPVPESLFMDGLCQLLQLDRDWVPTADLSSLYIRPCLFASEEAIGVKRADQYTFVIFTCPVGNYYTGPVDVLISENYTRAFPGGTGAVKAAGNYAAALLAEQQARESGFQSIMWLDGRERRYIEECGVMNVFFVLEDRVVTPHLSGTILPGITRDSAITLLEEMGIHVEQRSVSVSELMEAHARDGLRECFGTGTAATVAHVRRICFRENSILLSPVDQRMVGPKLRQTLQDIMTGRATDDHGWIKKP